MKQCVPVSKTRTLILGRTEDLEDEGAREIAQKKQKQIILATTKGHIVVTNEFRECISLQEVEEKIKKTILALSQRIVLGITPEFIVVRTAGNTITVKFKTIYGRKLFDTEWTIVIPWKKNRSSSVIFRYSSQEPLREAIIKRAFPSVEQGGFIYRKCAS